MTQASRGRRRGKNFTVRVTDEERATLEELQRAEQGPRALGPWLVWRALRESAGGALPEPGKAALLERAVPAQGGQCPRDRTILDLCAGSGSWSAPYEAAGYRVVRVTLPDHDVRTFEAPTGPIHGVLAGPPCDQFSLARNGVSSSPRDILRGLEVVGACLRVIVAARPTWWALENPVGLLSTWLGTPRDVWQPCDFGDPWTKRTAIWGDFRIPVRGPFVKPLGGGPFCPICDPKSERRAWCGNAAHRAVTPAGFARAFFEANP